MDYTKTKDGNLLLTFESNINIDNGFTVESQGNMVSTMELFTNEYGTPISIEWVAGNNEFIEHIGLWFDGKTYKKSRV